MSKFSNPYRTYLNTIKPVNKAKQTEYIIKIFLQLY